MNILKRVNIIGDETHGDRYRDAALFYPTVEVLAYNDSNFADYDTIILAEPYLWDDSFEKLLAHQKFSGLLIMEKMPFDSWEQFVRFSQEKHPFRICHAMLRLFEDRVVDTDSACLTIQWPNLTDSYMNRIRHTLPNALLFCHAQFGMDINSVRGITRTSHTLNVRLVNEKHCIGLEIYDTSDTGACVTVNGISLRWPSYMQLIHRFFDTVQEDVGDRKLNKAIVGDIIKVMETIEK